MDINKIHNGDCLKAMKLMKDNEFDLAIVDPPYGIGMSKGAGETRGDGKKKKDLYTPKEWDNERPSKEYFNELIRVSQDQIIWGGNYFSDLLKASRCWIYWRKKMGGNYSDGELAWTSFNKILKEYTKRPQQGNRIHPTQKPVKLYEWLLMNYAKEGDKILDTHLGSGSIAIACHNLGFDLTGYELDKEYFDNAIKRIKNHQAQLRII
jgi:site-specific DNA-methyltransferase (adenine-specific)